MRLLFLKVHVCMVRTVRFFFVVKMCTCYNGVAQTGVGCPVNGAANCLSCNTGFALNHAKTACVCTFAVSRPHTNQ